MTHVEGPQLVDPINHGELIRSQGFLTQWFNPLVDSKYDGVLGGGKSECRDKEVSGKQRAQAEGKL